MKQRYTHLDHSQSESISKTKTVVLKKPNPLLDRLSRIVEKAEPIVLASQQKNPLWVEKKPTALTSSFEKNYANEPMALSGGTDKSRSLENKTPFIQKNGTNTNTKIAAKKTNHFKAKAEGILGSLLGIILSIIVFVVVVVLIIFLVLLLI